MLSVFSVEKSDDMQITLIHVGESERKTDWYSWKSLMRTVALNNWNLSLNLFSKKEERRNEKS
jgi:hypothetical protein